MKRGRPIPKRIARPFLAGAALFALMLPVIAPFLIEMSSAVPAGASNINMYRRGSIADGSGGIGVIYPATLDYTTCKAKFTSVKIDDNTLSSQFAGAVRNIPNYPNSTEDDILVWMGNEADRGSILLGYDRANAQTIADIKYMLSSLNQYVPMIEFYKTDNLSTNPVNSSKPAVNGPADVCDQMKMILVNAERKEWRGFQSWFRNPIGASVGDTPQYMTFTLASSSSTDFTRNATGSLRYHFYDGPVPGQIPPAGWREVTANVTIDGSPDFTRAGGSVGGGTINAEWVDVSTIKIPNTSFNGQFGNDIYRKHQWGGDNETGRDQYAYYFLESAGADSRASITWASGKGCEKPLPGGSETAACNNGATNCVPFIRVKQWLDLSMNNGIPDITRLARDIDQLANAQSVLYDYRTNCTLAAKLTVASFAAAENSKIWFVYSETQDAFRTVWQSAAANEEPYNSITYVKINGVYQGGGPNNCMARVTITDAGAPREGGGPRLYGIDWTFFDQECRTNFGTLKVYALFDDGRFDEVVTPPATDVPIAEEPRIGCDFFTLNPLNWIVCPFIKGATSVIGYLDSAINGMLTIDVKQIFDTSTKTGAAYYSAWKVFRTFALALIVIAALAMVIAQAAGVEILDAYTVKKVLPRLLMAAIGITLSWQLMELAVTISNDLGNGIRSIIYAPFGSFTQELRSLEAGTSFVLILLGTAGVLAYGWVALLSLVVTGLLAALIAFFMLAFRQILITFLVMIAPFAIACAILPNTQKVWKLWVNTFMGALVVFLIISAFIATGRVFSVTALASDTATTVSQIIGIIAYFAPYFLIPYAFKLAGGVIATVSGAINDRSRGMFDRLKNFRQKESAARMERGGRRVLAKRASWADSLKTIGSQESTGWLGRRGARLAARAIGGYNVEAAASARQAAVAKEVNDQIATGRDEEIRGLTVNRSWLGRGFAAAQAAGNARVQDGRRQYRSLGGQWVDESHVVAGHQRWGRDRFAQQAALSYEMRKASTEEELQHLATGYADVATGSWHMNDTEAGGAWIGSAFENQNAHLEFKSTDWHTGQINNPDRLVDEVYEKRGSYGMAQMTSSTIEALKQAYEASPTDTPAGIDRRQKIAAIAETFMQEYGMGGQIGEAEGGVPIPAAPAGVAGAPGGRRQASTPGAAHVAERVAELSAMTRVMWRAPEGAYTTAPLPPGVAGPVPSPPHSPTPNDRPQKYVPPPPGGAPPP